MCYYGRTEQIASFTPKIFSALVAHTDSKEEAVRFEVAECLGGLAKIEPEETLAFLEKSLSSSAAFTRSVAVGALRYALASQTKHAIDKRLGKFLRMMQDADLEVRRQAILSFEAVLKSTELVNKPENSSLLKEIVVPVLYKETEPNKKFLKIIDAGALKIREDGHLPLRRAAFDALATIVKVCAYRLNMRDFYEYTMQGVLDADEDIVMMTWEMYFQISQDPSVRCSLKELGGGTSRNAIDGKKLAMDRILLNFVKKKMSTLKGTASRETDQARECVKKALVTVFTMLELPGMDQCKDFVHLASRIKQTKAIAKEVQEAKKILAQL